MPKLEIDGYALNYVDVGAGPVMVLVHGLGSSIHDLEYQIPVLCEHYRVIAVDLRGHGESGSPQGPWEMADFAGDIWALLGHLDIADFDLLGFSMGGSIALTMAAMQPERIRRLVLINTQPSYRVNDWSKLRELCVRLVMLNVLGVKRMSRMLVGRLFPYPEQAHLREKIVTRFSRNETLHYLWAMHAMIGFCMLDNLPDLHCPTLVIAGEQDYFSLEEKRRFIELMPNAVLKVIRDSRHATPLERPDEVNAALLEFLQGEEKAA